MDRMGCNLRWGSRLPVLYAPGHGISHHNNSQQPAVSSVPATLFAAEGREDTGRCPTPPPCRGVGMDQGTMHLQSGQDREGTAGQGSSRRMAAQAPLPAAARNFSSALVAAAPLCGTSRPSTPLLRCGLVMGYQKRQAPPPLPALGQIRSIRQRPRGVSHFSTAAAAAGCTGLRSGRSAAPIQDIVGA